MPQERPGVRPGPRADRDRREDSGDDQPDRGRDDEPGVRAGEEDAGRGECMQPEEAGAGEERERDEDQPRVAVTAGGDVGQVREHDADRRRQQDEPEVARMMLPVAVELRSREQEDQAREREGEQDPRDGRHATVRCRAAVGWAGGGHGLNATSARYRFTQPLSIVRTVQRASADEVRDHRWSGVESQQTRSATTGGRAASGASGQTRPGAVRREAGVTRYWCPVGAVHT